METAVLVEITKLILQISFALMDAANLTEEEKAELVNNERARFLKNRAQPLPDV